MTRDELTTAFVAHTMRGFGYEVREGPEAPVAGGAADSRTVAAGQLFTAFPGEHHDGNAFVDHALANGAVAVICERPPARDWLDRTIVLAPDATRAVGQLAHAWRRLCNPRVVGITGTVGKTTAKEITADLIATRFRTHRSEGNLNSREGLPLALLGLRRTHQVAVLEIAMDSKGEIAYLCDIAEPDIGIVLNIGLTHVSKLGSLEAIAREKLTLARYTAQRQSAVLNLDDPRIASGVPPGRVLGFGRGETAALRWGNAAARGLAGTTFDLSYGPATVAASCPVPGVHVVPGAVAAIGTALVLGMSLSEAGHALAAIETRGRSRTLRAASGATIIDDRYNSSPSSLRGALDLLATLPGRRIAFLGRMAELGPYEEDEHRKAGQIVARSCDLLVAVGPVCAPLAEAARQAGLADVRWFETKEEAGRQTSSILREQDTVLVKASRGEAFETILPILGVQE